MLKAALRDERCHRSSTHGAASAAASGRTGSDWRISDESRSPLQVFWPPQRPCCLACPGFTPTPQLCALRAASRSTTPTDGPVCQSRRTRCPRCSRRRRRSRPPRSTSPTALPSHNGPTCLATRRRKGLLRMPSKRPVARMWITGSGEREVLSVWIRAWIGVRRP